MYSLQGINGATRETKGKRYFEERVEGTGNNFGMQRLKRNQGT
jgi:hypothetical protein